MRNCRLLLLGVVLVLAVVPCLATPITFAGYSDPNGRDISVVYSTPGGTPTNTLETTGGGAVPILFYFQGLSGVPVALQGNLAAHLTLNATTTGTVSKLGPFVDQEGYSGSFTITLDAAYDGYAAGTFVLLAGTFGPNNSDLSGTIGSVSFSDSRPPVGEMNFTSDASFVPLTPGSAEAFWLTLFNITNLNTNGKTMFSGFSASSGGSFEADIIPEPFSFLLLGSGLVGLGLLRRKLR